MNGSELAPMHTYMETVLSNIYHIIRRLKGDKSQDNGKQQPTHGQA